MARNDANSDHLSHYLYKHRDLINIMNTNDQIIGIIGGTGLGDSLEKRVTDGKLVEVDTPSENQLQKFLLVHLVEGELPF